MLKYLLSHKLIFIVVILLIIQIPWWATVQHIADKTLVKTTATVIQENRYGSNCPARSRSLCDSSDVIAPVYQYRDTTGKVYTESDQYLGGYKQNNPLIKLFGRKVGDRVTAYYSKDDPQAVTFMTGPLAYSAFLIPLYLAIVIALIAAVNMVYLWFQRRQRSI